MPIPTGKFVIGTGAADAKVFLLGRNPGGKEAKVGLPFIGPAGEELEMYCTQAGINRNICYTTNLFKYYTPNDESPLISQYDHHFPITQRELLLVKPRVLVTLGGECTAYMMKKFGIDFRSMDAHHGIPLLATHDVSYADKPAEPFDPFATQWISKLWEKSPESGHVDTILFPAGHPASGLHQPSAMVHVSYDFYELASLLHGKIKPRDPHGAQHPMVRRLVTSPEDVAEIFKGCGGLCGLDTEGMPDYPWGLTFSVKEWEGYCILASQKDCIEEFKRQIAKMHAMGGLLIIHNCLHDLGVLEAMGIFLPDGSYVDTMVMAYLIGNLPQGLKPLSYRFFDIKMQDYMDVIEPYERANALGFIQIANGVDWDACPRCQAFRSKAKVHPVGGYEKVPAEHKLKDGKKLRKKFAELYTMCDEPVPAVPDRKHTISRRLERLLKDFESGAIVELEGDDEE